VYANACGDIEGYFEWGIPELQAPDQIWGRLTPLSWLIVGPETEDDSCDVMLSWLGSWDVEHEFSALFQDGRFVGIEHLGCFYQPADLKPSPG
jgi:hypothetical protein